MGAGHQNQLDTVYFTVPKRYIEEYGKLQRIKAEWYEYKTKDILVTSNASFFASAKSFVGVPLGDAPNAYGQYEYREDVGYRLGIGAGKAGDMYVAQWGWNLGTGYFHTPTNVLYYMFYVDDIREYDPYAAKGSTGGVESNDLYDYIRSYTKTFENGRLPVKNGTVSADLFEDDIDESRKMDNESGKIRMGYSCYDFDADLDTQVLSSWSDSAPSFWDNWMNFGLGAAFVGGPDEESRVVAPIQILNESDLSGSNATVSKQLLVNVQDVESIRSTYRSATANDEVVVLFRFATSDYYSRAAVIIEPDAGLLGTDKKYEDQAYIAKESVFFDFDIIQLTFNKEGVYTVIPVVSDPIDAVGGITPPVDLPGELEWWQVVFSLVMMVLLVLLLAPLWPYVVRAILWVFDYVGMGVRAVARVIRKRRNSRREE